MQTFKVSEKSWHWKPVGFWKSMFSLHHKPENFCQYWRWFVFGSAAILILSSVATFFLAALAYATYLYPLDAFYVVLSVVGAIGVVILFLYVLVGVDRYKRRRKDVEPGIIGMKYRSWKEKFCPSVVYED
jgi:hypothetical protein